MASLDETSVREWVKETEAAFDDLQALGPNWDSYGGQPIARTAIQGAKRLLGKAMAGDSLPPSVVPTSRGGVQLEWHMPAMDLEIEIQTDGSASFLLEQAGVEGPAIGDAWANLTLLRRAIPRRVDA